MSDIINLHKQNGLTLWHESDFNYMFESDFTKQLSVFNHKVFYVVPKDKNLPCCYILIDYNTLGEGVTILLMDEKEREKFIDNTHAYFYNKYRQKKPAI